MEMEYSGDRIRLQTTDAQSLVLRVLDPAGRVVYSAPRTFRAPGSYLLTVPHSAPGYRLLAVQQGNTAAAVRKTLVVH